MITSCTVIYSRGGSCSPQSSIAAAIHTAAAYAAVTQAPLISTGGVCLFFPADLSQNK
ncbi:hypothetical protein D3C80_2127240 [compost metagenome]